MHHNRQQLWEEIVSQVEIQYQALEQEEKAWLQPKLRDIADLQLQLNNLFMAAAGEQHCAHCAGDCCSAGHNHMTMVNLLQYLSRHEHPPLPDFDRRCPFLGDQGCLLSVAHRPYNCISFICDTIESTLGDEQIKYFYRIEARLRQLYFSVARRYRGAAMTGLFLQYDRLRGTPGFFDTGIK